MLSKFQIILYPFLDLQLNISIDVNWFMFLIYLFVNILIFSSRMKLIDGLKQMIYKSDLLCSNNLLRIKGQPQHQTILGGFISISLMIVLAAVFYNKIIDTFNRVIISSSFSATNAQDPSSFNITTLNNGSFMFGVEVWHHNLNQGKRYFDVVLTNTFYTYGEPQNTSVQYPLEPCRKDHWDGYPQIQNQYEKLNINYWMCLPKNTSFEIKGKYASLQSKTLDVAVKKCTNTSNDARPCASQVQIEQKFIDNDGPMFFTIYFLNPLINPDSQKYLSYYLQDSNYITFSPTGGQQSRIFVQDYEISTDLSIFPFSDYLIETGGIISSSPLKSTYTQIFDTYAVFFFYKSPVSVSYNRSFQKIDEVLSYIGGLFGTILIIFFLISSYNTHKFQINIAGYLYSNSAQQEKLEKGYNFIYFIGQLIYSVLKSLNFTPNWQKLKYYYETRQQTLKQLDILYLFKRINFLQKSISILFTENQFKGLYLAEHTTLSDAINIRNNFKMKPKLKNQIKSIRRNDQNNYYQQRENFENNKTIEDIFKDKQRNNRVAPQINQDQEVQLDSFNSDRYSSQSSSNQEQSNILGWIVELQKEGQRNVISKKIWNNIDKRLKKLIKPLLDKQPSHEQPQQINYQNQQQNIINIQQQSHQHLLLFLDPPNQEREQKNQCQNNTTKQLFEKKKGIATQASFGMHPKDK